MSADANATDDCDADVATDATIDVPADDADVRATMRDSPLGPGEDATPAERAVWAALDEVEDPHLPLSLVEMAMIYDVRVGDGGAEAGGDAVAVDVTFPCMGCPAYDFIHEDVREACRGVGFEDVAIDVVWDPVWSKDMMPDHAEETLRNSGIGI